MSFKWEIFRSVMIKTYHDSGPKTCPDEGKHGENYEDQCAITHSNSLIQAGVKIDNSIAERIAPGSFFTYEGECSGNGANGTRLARGAMNWWVYLQRSGVATSPFKYERIKVPPSIWERQDVPLVTMYLDNDNLKVQWLSKDETTPHPARAQTVKLQDIANEINSSNLTNRAKALLDEYEELSRTWREFFSFNDKLPRYMVLEGVWPRLIRLYLGESLSSGKGVVFYEQGGNSRNRGFHIDGFDIPFYLDGSHKTPWLGNDYSDRSEVTAVYISLI